MFCGWEGPASNREEPKNSYKFIFNIGLFLVISIVPVSQK